MRPFRAAPVPFHPSLFAALSLLPLAAAQSLTPSALVDSLLPTSTNASLVYGQRLSVRPFSLTVLANETHVQATMEVKKAEDEVGWLALGLGIEMADAAMLILWPSSSSDSTNSSWTLSHRVAGGHAMPDFNPAITSSTPGRWDLVPSLTFSSASSTVVTVLRSLSLSADQGVYPTSRTTYASLKRRKAQKLIYAASDTRPSSDKEGAQLTMHTGRNFGATTVDLSQSYIKPVVKTATTSSDGAEESKGGATVAEEGEVNEANDGKTVSTSGYSQYDYLILAHIVFAFLAWILLAPAAVLLARLGRKWKGWYEWHSSVQIYLVAPFTVIVLALGVAAAKKIGTASHFDDHKILGILITILVLVQLVLGYSAHLSPVPPARGGTRTLPRVFHILLGGLLLFCATSQSGWASAS
ncbi:hypothetical protein JCM8097_007657 [Rhodosporidiobolus ruineniae]